MKIAVVALGKIGLPLAVQFAEQGPRGRRRRRQPAPSSSSSTPGPSRSPARRDLAEQLTRGRAGRRAARRPPTRRRRPRSDAVVVVVPLFVDDERRARLRLDGRRDRGHRRRTCSPGTLVSYETTLPVGTTRTRWKPMLEEGSGLTEGADFHLVFSPERVLTGRVFADLRKYPKLVGGLIDEGGAPRRVDVLRGGARLRRAPRPAAANGVWDLGSAEAAELAKLAETTYRDVNIGLANQFARFADRHGIDVLPGDRGLQLPALQPHPPPGHRGRRPLHPGLPAALPAGTTPTRPSCARPARPTPAMPDYAVGLLERRVRRPDRRRGWSCSARPTAAASRRRRSPASSRTVDGAARPRGADVARARPDVHRRGARRARLRRRTTSASRSTPSSCRPTTPSTALSAESFPGVKVVVDGRRVLDRERFAGTSFLVVGQPADIV